MLSEEAQHGDLGGWVRTLAGLRLLLLLLVLGAGSIGSGSLRSDREGFEWNLSELDGSEWEKKYLQQGEAGSIISISEFMGLSLAIF